MMRRELDHFFFYREMIISKLKKDKLDLKNGFKENRRFPLVVDIIYVLGLFDLRQLPSFSDGEGAFCRFFWEVL